MNQRVLLLMIVSFSFSGVVKSQSTVSQIPEWWEYCIPEGDYIQKCTVNFNLRSAVTEALYFITNHLEEDQKSENSMAGDAVSFSSQVNKERSFGDLNIKGLQKLEEQEVPSGAETHYISDFSVEYELSFDSGDNDYSINYDQKESGNMTTGKISNTYNFKEFFSGSGFRGVLEYIEDDPKLDMEYVAVWNEFEYMYYVKLIYKTDN